MISIRRALFSSLGLALVFGTLAVCITAYFASREEVYEMFDGQMRQSAFTIEAQEDQTGGMPHMLTRGRPLSSARTYVKGEKEFLIDVWDKTGKLVYSSHPAINFPKYEKRGLIQVGFQGEDWRVFSLPRDGELIQIAQPLLGRETMTDEITLKLLAPALIQFPLFAFFGWMAVRRSLEPLKAVSGELGQRSANAMTPVDIAQVPEEIQPLGRALNDLLARLDAALTQQRQFTADAAHELRTPLAAIQLQMELLSRAKSEAERADSLERLKQGVARSVDLVQQLLVFARVEPQDGLASAVPIDLGALLRDTVTQFTPAARKKNIAPQLSRCETLRVSGDTDKLQILLNNLLENAIRYTPDGGSLTASLAREGNNALLEIVDNGPGIPEAERQRVFDRFYRIAGTKTQGTGLGLAIVKRIADQHGAAVTLQDGAGGKGLCVKIAFPLLP